VENIWCDVGKLIWKLTFPLRLICIIVKWINYRIMFKRIVNYCYFTWTLFKCRIIAFLKKKKICLFFCNVVCKEHLGLNSWGKAGLYLKVIHIYRIWYLIHGIWKLHLIKKSWNTKLSVTFHTLLTTKYIFLLHFCLFKLIFLDAVLSFACILFFFQRYYCWFQSTCTIVAFLHCLIDCGNCRDRKELFRNCIWSVCLLQLKFSEPELLILKIF
jgi:hypothetical protein